MGEKKVESGRRKVPPARTPEELEKRCINLAISQAEKMLEEGTAPNSIVLHYLKLGTSESELKKEKLEHETTMLQAKTDALKAAVKYEQIVEDAMRAFKGYATESNDEDGE